MAMLIALVWVLQFVAMVAAVVLCFVAPETFVWLVWPDANGLTLATIATARLLVPVMAGIAMLSYVGAMTEDLNVRRRMAGAFSILGALCCVRELTAGPGEHLRQPLAFLAGVAFGLQFLFAFAPWRGPIAPHVPGTADTKPPALWGLWVIQGFTFIAIGSVLWGLPFEWLARALYPAGTLDIALPPIVRMEGALWIGLGLFSLQATNVLNEWNWRLYSTLFALGELLFILVLLFAWSPDALRWWVLLAALPGTALLIGNVAIARRPPDPTGEDMGVGPEGWTIIDVPTGPALAVQSLGYWRRSTHLMGVGARGTFVTIANQNGLPPNSFFKPGREFKLHARFATLSSVDDATSDVRGAGIQLLDEAGTSSLFDMLMNSGEFVATPNMVLFAGGVLTRFFPYTLFEKAVKDSLQTREALIAGRRRAPASYSLIHYYTQTVRFWVDDQDNRHLVRYRLLDPNPDHKETGISTQQEEDAIWIRARLPSENRPSDYLRNELKTRLESNNPIHLRFQAQFHLPVPGDSLDWYNAGVDWPPECEWFDIGDIHLTTALSDAETELLRLNAANHPPSLGIPAATGPLDFRSLADSERRVIERLQRLRLRLYNAGGLPKFGNTLPGGERKS